MVSNPSHVVYHGAPVVAMPQAIAVAQPMAMHPGMMPAVGIPMQMPAGHALDPMETLQQLKSIWISQKVNIAEAVSGCEFENRYAVYNTEKKGDDKLKKDKEAKIFKCKEQSTCCQRQCTPGSMREFKMDILFGQHELDPVKGILVKRWNPFMEIKRDYTCTCCCLSRPILRVNIVYKGHNQTLGYIKSVWKCCDNELLLYKDTEADAEIKVTSPCCKCGFYCQCPCASCKEVTLDIVDIRAGNARVGEIKKEWTGCAQEMFTNADDYTVQFPAKQTWQQKALLLAAALFVDYLYFEENHDNQNHNN